MVMDHLASVPAHTGEYAHTFDIAVAAVCFAPFGDADKRYQQQQLDEAQIAKREREERRGGEGIFFFNSIELTRN